LLVNPAGNDRHSVAIVLLESQGHVTPMDQKAVLALRHSIGLDLEAVR
jgi:hypothetical protein